MITAGKAMLRVVEKLQPVVEYFDQKADAEYETSRAEPIANEEMRLLVTVQDCICELESAAADVGKAE